VNFLKSLGRILITALLAGVVGYLLIFNARLIMAAGYEAGYRAGQDSCTTKTGVETTGDYSLEIRVPKRVRGITQRDSGP
jgi:hypothetical protein